MFLRRILVVAAVAATGLMVNTVPAHAAPAQCTVNGTVTVAALIDGTSGNDTITCTAVPVGSQVRGLAGDDTINVTTANAGSVIGGEGKDNLLGLGNTGTFNGSADDDYIQLEPNGGNVYGGTGDDEAFVQTNTGTISGGDGNDDLGGDVNLAAASVTGDAGELDVCQWEVNAGTIDCEFR